MVALEQRPAGRSRRSHSRRVTALAGKFPPQLPGDSSGALSPQSLRDTETHCDLGEVPASPRGSGQEGAGWKMCVAGKLFLPLIFLAFSLPL